MKKNKLVLGIIGALIMIVCTFFLAFYAVRDYYIAHNGIKVEGRVVGNANACRRWDKFVSVHYREDIFEIRLYGKCRSAEFPINQVILLRSNTDGTIVVLESNHYTFRLWFMLLLFVLSLLVNFLMYNQYKFWKRSASDQRRMPA